MIIGYEKEKKSTNLVHVTLLEEDVSFYTPLILWSFVFTVGQSYQPENSGKIKVAL